MHFLCIQKAARSGEMFARIVPDLFHAHSIHPVGFCLCTAKDGIHPQCPQGYPQFRPGKLPEYRGFPSGYPHCPQVFHRVYPICFHMWIFMWTFNDELFRLLLSEYNCMFIHVRVCSAGLFCVIRGHRWPDCTAAKTFECNENEIPQRSSLMRKRRCCRAGDVGLSP